MTLYLKYRPQTLDELDLESVRDSLKSIITSGDIPHAFLFSGPKGTGKTSAARILAKVVNCENLGKNGEPCNKCDSCISITKGNNIDIIELDAASNRGIDDIRNLKSSIYLAPALAKKKIYIIDEVHMLTLEAANAFLKTLEEPPDHVVFILATTNPEKLPETVISRLTQVNFTKASSKDISRQLTRVAKGEKVKIEEKAIEIIAKKADGSFRDAVKILESLILKTKNIKVADVENLLPTLSGEIEEFFAIIESKNVKEVLTFIENLVEKGISIRSFTEKISEKIHINLLAKNGIGEDTLANFSASDLITLNELLSESMKVVSPVSQLPLEIAVVKFLDNSSLVKITLSEKDESEGKTDKEEKIKEEVTIESKPVIKSEETPKIKLEKVEIEVEKPSKDEPVSVVAMDEAVWQKLLLSVREKNVSIEALLRAVKPINYDGKNLNLGVYYQFHKDHLENVKNNKILEEICKETLGTGSIRITYELIDRPVKKVEEEKRSDVAPLTGNVDKDIIEAAKEIFS